MLRQIQNLQAKLQALERDNKKYEDIQEVILSHVGQEVSQRDKISINSGIIRYRDTTTTIMQANDTLEIKKIQEQKNDIKLKELQTFLMRCYMNTLKIVDR